ncbi:lysophospholipid acyltransferase family protein [Geomicrobium sediminis]|uniref:1-acyl-sn-glycerol-3-phosphate acyltransferase n=1 Tax=Geomicrobium sediminis TaxID=1347788 RepID=A0ABS2PEW7_9BACL|nr:lysophospholipid acyltransferase family protein [Geomicrobium sediminis]MBM7633610.1 1-acyl-sn-glycerol-3-phosphate acyltransferase [Geomicrobium sediminis]
MIKANKSRLFHAIFRPFMLWQFRKNFYGIHVLDERINKQPTSLFVMNHSSWWDGLLCLLLNEKLFNSDAYMMMDEEGLQKFPFFRRLGAFSINSKDRGKLRTSYRYTQSLLQSKKSVWLFPQGEERHQELRPLAVQRGVVHFHNKAPHGDVTFISAYYTFLREQKPEVFIHVQTCTLTHTTIETFEEQMTRQLDRLRNSVITGNLQQFETFVAGRRTISEWFQTLSRRSERKQ